MTLALAKIGTVLRWTETNDGHTQIITARVVKLGRLLRLAVLDVQAVTGRTTTQKGATISRSPVKVLRTAIITIPPARKAAPPASAADFNAAAGRRPKNHLTQERTKHEPHR